MITLPLLSMSVGAPNAVVSITNTVSYCKPIVRYSASVYPPVGLAVSATTIALFVIATTRPPRMSGTWQAAEKELPVFVFNETVSPTANDAALVASDGLNLVPALDADRPRYHDRAAGMSGVRTRRSLARSWASKSVEVSRSEVLFPLGTVLNTGASAYVRDCSGVVTAEAPELVKLSTALRA